MRLTTFEPAASSVIEPMHNSYLGIVKDFTSILFHADVLMDGERTEKFGRVFKDAVYPSHLSRIPDRIREQIEDTGLKANGANLKADQWKRLSQMLPVVAFIEWEEDEEEMREGTDMDRWWRVIIELCTGMRILHAHNITYREAVVGVEALSRAAKYILLYGPLSGMGGWSFERHNGVLVRVKNNKNTRSISQTLLRNWIMQSRLLSIISNPSPTAPPAELHALERIRDNRAPRRPHGRAVRRVVADDVTGETRIMTLSAPVSPSKSVNLEALKVYGPLLDYLHQRHEDLHFRHYLSVEYDASFVAPVRTNVLASMSAIRSDQYYAHSSAKFDDYKFNSSEIYGRTDRDRYALAADVDRETRNLCLVRLILTLNIFHRPSRRTIPFELAFVDFYQGQDQSDLPWKEKGIGMGIKVYRQDITRHTFIPVQNLQAPAIVISHTRTDDHPYLFAISSDTEGPEPEYFEEAAQTEGNSG
ncbi:hypothetical protein QFC24_006871 [Naganishia onofrii]|uniref:Uncharacterized protein n=1 Tax=Naganishia onofrii TaxID=1851511 RepID=A0ACC2WVH4_9TREE|nr:hypothetical protein QFC24_006871 [Naganishia onofrii]